MVAIATGLSSFRRTAAWLWPLPCSCPGSPGPHVASGRRRTADVRTLAVGERHSVGTGTQEEKRMRLTKLRHSCVRLDKDGSVLVIDPGIWSDASAALAGASAALVTHEHADHVDVD